MNIFFLQFADIVGLLLIDPKDLLDGRLKGHFFSGQDGKLLFKIELHDLVRQLIGIDAGPVGTVPAVIQDSLYNVQVLFVIVAHTVSLSSNWARSRLATPMVFSRDTVLSSSSVLMMIIAFWESLVPKA